MRQAKSARARTTTEPQAAPVLRVVPRPAPAPQLGVALVHAVRDGEVVLEVGSELVTAALDPSVHPTVIEGARARGERVLVEQQGAKVMVIGALRTQPTPGIDRADEYSIEAKRITLRADEELSLRAQTAALALRAIGEVETYAERIVSRAEGVHKLIGRMLRLN